MGSSDPSIVYVVSTFTNDNINARYVKIKITVLEIPSGTSWQYNHGIRLCEISLKFP